MRTKTKILTGTVVLAAAGWFAGCNGTIDSEPNVVLEVGTLSIPPITVTRTAGICTYTITNANATFNNKPKNSLAGTSPFNDIILQQVLVSYVWDGGGGTLVDQPFGIGGTIPANGSGGVQFAVVGNETLNSLANPEAGHTASLVLKFKGTTVAGEAVSATSGGSLTVNSCAPEPLGACCVGGNCVLLTQFDCQVSGGDFLGDGTSCGQATCTP